MDKIPFDKFTIEALENGLGKGNYSLNWKYLLSNVHACRQSINQLSSAKISLNKQSNKRYNCNVVIKTVWVDKTANWIMALCEYIEEKRDKKKKEFIYMA